MYSCLVSLYHLLFEAFLISSNSSKETGDICPEVPVIQHGQTPAISKPVTLAGVTAPMGRSMDVCPTTHLPGRLQPRNVLYFRLLVSHSHCCAYLTARTTCCASGIWCINTSPGLLESLLEITQHGLAHALVG